MSSRDHTREILPLIAARPRHLHALADELGISEVTTAVALGWLKIHSYALHTVNGYLATQAGLNWIGTT